MPNNKVVRLFSVAPEGLNSHLCEVEVQIQRGLPCFHIVGLPEASVREAKERVRSAILASGFNFPLGRITINLSPGDLKKEGSHYDLPIALGILLHTKQIPLTTDFENCIILGELGLNGQTRTTKSCFAKVISLLEIRGYRFIIPKDNLNSLLQLRGGHFFGSSSLGDFANQNWVNQFVSGNSSESLQDDEEIHIPIEHQETVINALEIAAAGNHPILLVGPPGSGKTTLARFLPQMLPELSYEEKLSITRIHSLSGQFHQEELMRSRPFRCPSPGVTSAAFCGGGAHAKPGEISLAHHGVLFLDEFSEFQTTVLENLRIPMVEGKILLNRQKSQQIWPASFLLIAAMNPCHCGWLGDREKPCKCSQTQLVRYQQKISGPLMDRFDLKIELHRPSKAISRDFSGVSLKEIKKRVHKAREIQKSRGKGLNTYIQGIKDIDNISKDAEKVWSESIKSNRLSVRASLQVLKVARSIADLNCRNGIEKDDVLQAIWYKSIPERTI
ncbi:MAG: YifB family Mg chelatase-like AAA ATPase [Candidatus Cloacimonetes bacterium]|nr:YifB family Mg chelatase-like AAA ATPase [Candidatus Cloacimonadota bacterium]